jgi:hypothetical protein
MLEMGAKHSGIDMMKNWMLAVDADKLSFLMNKRIIGEKELSSGGSGQAVKVGFKDIMIKMKNGITRLPTLFNLVNTLKVMKKQMAAAKEIEPQYSPSSFAAWQKKYSKRFDA